MQDIRKGIIELLREELPQSLMPDVDEIELLIIRNEDEVVMIGLSFDNCRAQITISDTTIEDVINGLNAGIAYCQSRDL